MPERIQLRRTKGWRKPEGAVSVARPSKWGNPFRAVEGMGGTWRVVGHGLAYTGFASRDDAIRGAVDRFRAATKHVVSYNSRIMRFSRADLDFLRGRDLACWCPLVDGDGRPAPCHADILLELANGEAR